MMEKTLPYIKGNSISQEAEIEASFISLKDDRKQRPPLSIPSLWKTLLAAGYDYAARGLGSAAYSSEKVSVTQGEI